VSWAHNTYTFTATATSHELVIAASAPTGNASVLVDDITLMGNAWTEAGTTTSTPQDSVTDFVVRSQSGRIMKNVLTDGLAVETSTYSFDAAGRLVEAVIPRHVLSYSFGLLSGYWTGVAAAAALAAAGRAASTRSSTASSWAADTNQASKTEGGRETPAASMAWKNGG
jgi:hypothetical protein